MTRQLFVHNVAPDVTEERIRTLFAEVGPVATVQRPVDRETGKPRRFAFVTMDSDEAASAAIERFNGHELDGQEITVQVAKAQRKQRVQTKTAAQKLAAEIAGQLNEEAKRPQAQIRSIIEEMGVEFTQKLLADTLEIQAQGGMPTLDATRQRTPGGVFFKLAKERLPAELRAQIFPNWRELKRRRKAAEARREAQQNAEDQKRSNATGTAAPKSTTTRSTESKGTRLSIEAAREQLANLRETEKAAQQRLADIQAGKIRGGMLEALKVAAEVKARITTLLSDFPELQ